MKTTLEQLVAEKELLSDPARWTKHSQARNKEGEGILSTSIDAVCWCQSGASHKITQHFDITSTVDIEAYTIKNKVAEMYNFHSAVAFNDANDTDHTKLMEFYDKCIESVSDTV